MATKTKKATKKGDKPSVAKKVNTSLVNVSLSAINTTIENGEKWQKLASKLIKKSEKVREQQINMIFDTAEAVKGQVMIGADKMKDLVGIDDKLIEKAKNKVINNPISRKVVGIVEDITEKVTENPMVQKAEKATEDMKVKGMVKFNELKGDVLKQAYNVVNTAENKLEDARKDLKKEVNKATKASKSSATKAKVTKAKATKVVAKKAPKKTVAKKVAPKAKVTVAKKTTAVKKATVTKATEAKKEVTKVAEVKTEVNKTIKISAKDDLKLIYGIGPKTELALNNNGVNTYAEYAKLETAEVEAILEKETVSFASTDLKDWKKQAEVAVKEGAEGLVKWVERYRTA
ncbi:hypothetical protein [Psychroserpens luteus]|uniref:Helix-hairpin-helix domain-containing protein n=1 Tax=Psychroserpens luteus TaxID=1434066 RepID=A0ABW5ZNM8_9FLAO|nr:hypothetical protein [Psychroserpens luteus]